jgi:hypothetical protein
LRGGCCIKAVAIVAGVCTIDLPAERVNASRTAGGASHGAPWYDAECMVACQALKVAWARHLVISPAYHLVLHADALDARSAYKGCCCRKKYAHRRQHQLALLGSFSGVRPVSSGEQCSEGKLPNAPSMMWGHGPSPTFRGSWGPPLRPWPSRSNTS